MIFSGPSPVWFLGWDALLELLFLFVAAFIAWYGFRAYRLSGKRRFFWWSVGFGCITLAYAVNAFSNYYLFGRVVHDAVPSVVPAVLDTGLGHLFGYLAYTGLFLTGYTLLAMVALHFDDERLITLFASLVGLLSLAIVAAGKSFLFTATAIFLLAHVLVFNWMKLPRGKKRASALQKTMLVGFSGLLLGQLAYLAMPLYRFAYVAGHVFELAGYGSLLLGMVVVLGRRRK